jgi:hypothetical protein
MQNAECRMQNAECRMQKPQDSVCILNSAFCITAVSYFTFSTNVVKS